MMLSRNAVLALPANILRPTINDFFSFRQIFLPLDSRRPTCEQ
jgi:hypothetical protein